MFSRKKPWFEKNSFQQNAPRPSRKAQPQGGRANTHSNITTHEKVLFVKQVLLIFS
jgi:hypothetical protein